MAKLSATIFALFAFLHGAAHAHPIIGGLRGDTDTAFAGHVLLGELNCTACHAGDAAAKGAPDLRGAGARIRRDYLVEFIAQPHATHPGTTMPDMLGGLSAEARASTAGAIADYLLSLDDARLTLEPIGDEGIDRGRGLFHTVGCVACHSPEDRPLPDSPPLHRLADKYSLGSLTAFLEDPLAVRPDGRMPDLQLTHWEASDLASYLLRDQEPEQPHLPEPARVAEGKRHFESFGCAQCHEPKTARTDFARPLAELDAAKTCASADFDLAASQRTQIAAALGNPAANPDPILLTLTRLNCLACHSRDGIGGPAAERDAYFTTSNLNLGDQARLPPSLTGVGAKLTPAWLRKVLVAGASVRPYTHTRMPRFGAANVEPLLEPLARADATPASNHSKVNDKKLARETGFHLVGVKNLACIACHTFNGEGATTLAGMELTTMPERLREDWFHRYLLSPQDFTPTTIMPAFWPGGKAVRPELLDGDADRQIDAIWQYLSQGREARMPEGLRHEPLEFGPIGGEAVMLRRQYHGIGKRGIGVGYPSGINLVFDAGQLRLGTLWRGNFGEMSGVWRGQGSGDVGERGRQTVRFPVGPAFALLESADAEWPTLEQGAKAPGFQFQGYTLDDSQRPTFRYRFGELEITDAFLDHPDGPSLTRTLTFSQPAPQHFYFRLASDKDLKPGETEHTYAFPQNLVVLAPPGTILLPAGDLRLPLAGRQSLAIEYRFQPE